ncbi:mono-functional DNA-alkylating methyl methanesulfonate N-term-domain-containing protein [Podospora australis]|uniref:Mono-functional DNA-alkylating methyl methanesulfonate N-term-domain-containing protein n=1 Tax=Podospora australis TaxID=1536484 RepID=A0AAN6X5S7_9PEZI|nr:mono-functional DNA-alkylating methyl methanesulfonate N-term-domain-containing protein [Podospora australis]
MAALQMNFLQNGVWGSQVMTVEELIKKQQESSAQSPINEGALQCPEIGLLTRTISESPLVNKILPVRIRSAQHNDVAFVGDVFIQICELQVDGRLREIIRYNNFASRIENAAVVGTFDIDETAASSSQHTIKVEDSPSQFGLPQHVSQSPDSQLPPQMLMVVLEGGDIAFLYLRSDPNGNLQFVIYCEATGGQRIAHPGYHMAVDPSSRYVALAPCQDFFIVYEFEPRQELEKRHSTGQPLSPIRANRIRGLRGAISNMTFLYPRHGDNNHIILLLIVVRNGRSKMIIYEWMLGDDLKTVFSEEKNGHRMPDDCEMPLFLVPLRTNSAFLVVSPEQIAVCKQSLHGPPTFEAMHIGSPDPTDSFHGRGEPLWTSWAKPLRLTSYFEKHDCFYLAREDGVVVFIEVDREGSFDRSIPMQFAGCNVSTALACTYNPHADMIILGSSSGPGGVWRVLPRGDPELLSLLDNWAPVVDFATTDDPSERQPVRGDLEIARANAETWQSRGPSRIFATCEGSRKGMITEFRYGLKATIGLDLEYGPSIKQAWIFPSHFSSSGTGYHVLLSMPDHTEILHLSSDFSEANNLAPGSVPYDLEGSTLVLTYSEQLIIQVTTQGVVLRNWTDSTKHLFNSFECLAGAIVSDADVRDDCVVISAHNRDVYIFKIDPATPGFSHVRTVEIGAEVTCLSLTADFTLLVGIWGIAGPSLVVCSLQQASNSVETILLYDALSEADADDRTYDPSHVEAIASIASLHDTVYLGTRGGEVIVMSPTDGYQVIDYEQFGTASVNLSCNTVLGRTSPILLLTCDNKLLYLDVDDHNVETTYRQPLETKLRVWPVETPVRMEAALNPSVLVPPVQFATAVDIPSEDSNVSVLMVAGTRVLLAGLHREPTTVPRSIPVDGTPQKLIYSHHNKCLIVAGAKDGKTTMWFLDPDTGSNIGQATEKNDREKKFISGLGIPGDKVLELTEWKNTKDGKSWHYIVVATQMGSLLVISTQKAAAASPNQPARIRYWTRWKKTNNSPITAVQCYDGGLVYCVGDTVRWEVIDEVDKKLRAIGNYQLDSPAVGLKLSHGQLIALTIRDSILILDHITEGGIASTLRNSDPGRRNGVHFLEISGSQPESTSDSIVLVADRDCGVTALWVPWAKLEQNCKVLAQAGLLVSMRRLRQTRTRPVWEQRQHTPRWGRRMSSLDDAEILGVSLSGSLLHFTLLGENAWRFLRYLQNLALGSEEVSPFTWQRWQSGYEPLKDEKHVDGDVLQRCLQKRALERLVQSPEQSLRFRELLDAVDMVGSTVEGEGDMDDYFQLAYEILDYFLRPVL